MRSRLLPLVWGLVVAAVCAHQLHFWMDGRVDTDVLALLPASAQAPEIDLATRALTESTGRELVILVGAASWEQATQAARRVSAVLGEGGLLEPSAVKVEALEESIRLYRPFRDRLLTPAQATWLEGAPAERLGATALMKLMQPAGAGLTEWNEDPLGLWPDWWAARAAESPARPRDGLLWLSAEDREWVLLGFRSVVPTFSLGDGGAITQSLARAKDAATAEVTDVRVLSAGAPLYAEAAASQASWEISTIGTGSLIAVLFLMWITFRSLRPLVLVGLSLVIGSAVATSVTAIFFGRVHLITLIFGATLIGVAEDYGFHYFAARSGKDASQRHAIMRLLLPGMALALLTSVVAYLALGLAPFPGLRQMAVFSVAGLAGAFLTVVCWIPWMDRGPLPVTPFSQSFAATLDRWPRLSMRPTTLIACAACTLFIIGGIWRLTPRDDVRQLLGAPAALVADQRDLGRLLGLPSPSQFFVVQGKDAEETLSREVLLKARLDDAVEEGLVAGYRAVSDWLPSLQVQHANAALSLRAETHALAQVQAAVGEAPARATFDAGELTPEVVLASSVGASLRPQWFRAPGGEQLSVVLLRGLDDPSVLPRLAELAAGLPGVQWVDRTAEITGLLAHYRRVMGVLVVVGYAAVLLTLALRFGRSAWRAWVPSVVGTLLTLGALGWMGEPLQLFTVLGLLVLLGMGVDYGIFLLEHPGDRSAWLAVALAGISTLLSFGLLALSATPALRSFGLTLLIGEVVIWALTPFFRIPHAPEHTS